MTPASTFAFAHDTPAQRVVFAPGASRDLTAELDRLAAAKVMTIAGARHAAVADAVPAALRWDEVVQHVPVGLAERARAAADEAGVDAVVAIGGGSAIGLAKAIALMRAILVLAVPTTYAGSEATSVWGLTDADGKRTGVDPRALPVSVVYDAELVLTMPPDLAAASGLNAVAHCVDAFWGPTVDPLDTALAGEALRALHDGLPAAVGQPSADACARVQYGCYLAAVAFASAGSGLHHKICHVLGGRFGLAHAPTHAVVLPHVAALNLPAARDASRRVSDALGTADPLAGLVDLRARVGGPSSLRELGLAEADLPDAAGAALAAVPASNPVPLDHDGMLRLLRAAWAGMPPATGGTA